MRWFRRYSPLLSRLMLAVWLLAFGITAMESCLGDGEHGRSLPFEASAVAQHGDDRTHPGEVCQQQCINLASTASRTLELAPAHLLDLALPFVAISLLVFAYIDSSAVFPLVFPSLARRTIPARLSFVRLNT